MPVTPDEIADDAVRVVAAGASIVHLHARDGDGSPSYRREIYASQPDDVVAILAQQWPEH